MKNRYIYFSRARASPTGKTQVWRVMARTSGNAGWPRYALGDIKWKGAWWKYVYYPRFGTLYDDSCLQDIAAFCTDKTKAIKKEWRA